MSSPLSSGHVSHSEFLSRGCRLFACILVIAGALAGCAEDRLAGASTETTNGLIGTVRDQQGSPVAQAQVSVWNARGDSLLGRTTTDGSGRWGIPAARGMIGIQVYSHDSTQGAWRGGEVTRSDDSIHEVSMRLGPVSELTIESHPRARLAGTPWRTLDGTFRRIPSNSYAVLSDTGSTSHPLGSVFVTPSSHDTLALPLDTGLLIEDFDDGDSTWIFGPVRDPMARWFTQTSPRGAALFYPLADESTATSGMQTAGAWRGRSLRMEYYTADSGSFVQAGFYFRGYLDLSDLKSIRVRLKGDGIVHFGLSGYGYSSGRAVWEAHPDSIWRQFVFKPGEELPSGDADPPHVAFSSVSNAVFLLMIQSFGGSELSIDDIRFEGIEPEACLP